MMNNLLRLARWMAGDLSNQKQAFTQPQLFAHMQFFCSCLPKQPVFYAGLAEKLDILQIKTLDGIELCDRALMIFLGQGDKLGGCVAVENQCLSSRNGCKIFLGSEVKVSESSWVSLDKGKDIITHTYGEQPMDFHRLNKSKVSRS
jgi:CpeT protein